MGLEKAVVEQHASAGSPPIGRPSIRSGVIRLMRPSATAAARAAMPASNSRPFERDQAAAALLDVDRRAALDQREPRSGGAGRLAGRVRPGSGHAVRVGGVGRRQHHRLGAGIGLAQVAQPLDRGRQRELGAAQALDEVAAAGTAPDSSIARSSP